MSVIFALRCFTFGIGSGASTALVEGLARAGNGTAEFVKEGERMQPKVRMYTLQPRSQAFITCSMKAWERGYTYASKQYYH